jgi:hypothetical protein
MLKIELAQNWLKLECLDRSRRYDPAGANGTRTDSSCERYLSQNMSYFIKKIQKNT